jgi:class 3 adenylate cyclase
VNVAFRLAGDAPAGEIQIDVTTYRRLQHRFRFADPQEVSIKGKGLMQVYRLAGPAHAAARPAV